MDDSVFELIPTAFAYGGDAIGRVRDGARADRVVFVPFALPGERVRVRVVEERRGFLRGQLLELLEPSPQRITPRCRHFGVCGGCHYQHLPYQAQLGVKADILRDQFRRIGHIDDPPVHAAVASPQEWNYRNQVQFHLTSDGRLGYVAADAPAAALSPEPPVPPASLFPITECHLPEPALNGLWPRLEFEPDMDLERVSIRQGAGEELMLILESDDPVLPGLEMDASVSVVHAFGDDTAVMAGREGLTMNVLGRDFRISAPSFFQVNTPMAARMVQHVLGLLRSPGSQPAANRESLPQDARIGDRIPVLLDIYCGVGLFSAFLAPHCRRLIGVEASPAACNDFTANLDEFENVELYEDRAENVLPVLDVEPEVILVDPPRAGIEPQARDAILRMAPQMLIYVSCDPSTLARDARRFLDGGYRLRSVTPFDLFPQTFHIESITCFEKGE